MPDSTDLDMMMAEKYPLQQSDDDNVYCNQRDLEIGASGTFELACNDGCLDTYGLLVAIFGFIWIILPCPILLQ